MFVCRRPHATSAHGVVNCGGIPPNVFLEVGIATHGMWDGWLHDFFPTDPNQWWCLAELTADLHAFNEHFHIVT